jgi:hypothetical protein
MHSRKAPWSFVVLVAAGLTYGGCADFHRGPAPLDGAAPSNADASVAPDEDLVFEGSVYSILQLRCASCHSAGGAGDSSRFLLTGNAHLDRAMVKALVTPGNSTDSLLLQRASGEGHEGGKVLIVDSPEYKTISNWILGLQ